MPLPKTSQAGHRRLVACFALFLLAPLLGCNIQTDSVAPSLPERDILVSRGVTKPDATQPGAQDERQPGNQNRGADDSAVPTAPGVFDRSSSRASKLSGEINFDDLKFPIEKDQPFTDSMLTDEVKALSGREVKLRGYILPSSVFQMDGFKRFVLVRDNQECCFGPGAALFDCVMVKMVGDATADFVTRPVTVKGRFEIDTEEFKYPGGRGPQGQTHLAVFEMAATNVQ